MQIKTTANKDWASSENRTFSTYLQRSPNPKARLEQREQDRENP